MSIAVYTTHNTELSKIENIMDSLNLEKSYFLAYNNFIPQITNKACINFYHIINQVQHHVLFLNHLDFNEGSHYFSGRKILVISKSDIINVDKNVVDNTTEVFFEENNKIRKAKNAELQSIFR